MLIIYYHSTYYVLSLISNPTLFSNVKNYHYHFLHLCINKSLVDLSVDQNEYTHPLSVNVGPIPKKEKKKKKKKEKKEKKKKKKKEKKKGWLTV